MTRVFYNGLMEAQTAPAPTIADRVVARQRPSGWPIMHQTWGKLLFIHWPIRAEVLRPKIPAELEIDTHEGQAWIAITPFTMWNVRPSFFPPLPYLSQAHELNVRTYVHYRGVPGVWFFSLDINHALAVPLARAIYHLPYYQASIHLQQDGKCIDYHLRRDEQARFKAQWSFDHRLLEAMPGTLEYFLCERYALYSYRASSLYRARIWHEPWPLRSAALHSLDSTMIQGNGLPQPDGQPLVHYADQLPVEIWPIHRVDPS
jgi:uncharacterized protein